MKPMQSKIIYVAFLAFLTLTACKSAAVSENTTQSTNSSTAKTVAADADPKTVLVSSMKALQNAPSWVADIDNSNDAAPQAAAKMRVKYAAPDNFQIENDTAGNKMEIISVGKDTFMQMNGKWQKAPASVNMGQMINNFKDAFSPEKMDAFRNIAFAGKETVDGKELSAYTYEIDQQAAMPEELKSKMTDEMRAQMAEVQSENRAKIWIDTEKNLPAKMEMTMKMSKPQQVTSKVSIRYKYDEAVKIEAPKL